MKIKTILAQNLKKIREQKNFSQKGMAQHIGISTKLYNELENATANATLETLEKIAESLELSLEKLLLPQNYKLDTDENLLKIIDKLLIHNEKLFLEHTKNTSKLTSY